MKGKLFKILLVSFLLISLISCGPSEEAIATMTAAAWTPTPLPTPTPTPIPYGLRVSITDKESIPISFAYVLLQELGEDMHEVDDGGQVSFGGLPGDTVTLDVSAPGYFSSQVSETIERGENEISVILKQDPGGYLPSQACREDETLLYIEDFQDGKAQNWGPITNSLEYNVPGWLIQPDTEKPDNQILIATNSSDFANSDYDRLDPFSNAVWRIKVKFEGNDNDMFLNWLHGGTDEGDWRYTIQFGGPAMLDLGRLQMPEPGHFSTGRSGWLKENQWYDFEISTFNGTTEVWLDGDNRISYTDPHPLEGGTIGLEVHLFEGSNSIYYFDNIAVCGLSAPFETIIIPEPD